MRWFRRRQHQATVFLQWKGTNACYDLYCLCEPDEPRHFDGLFGQEFTCGNCGRRWLLPSVLTAVEVV